MMWGTLVFLAVPITGPALGGFPPHYFWVVLGVGTGVTPVLKTCGEGRMVALRRIRPRNPRT